MGVGVGRFPAGRRGVENAESAIRKFQRNAKELVEAAKPFRREE